MTLFTALPHLEAYDLRALQRLERRILVRPDTGCWEWQGAHTPTGYGMLSYVPTKRRWEYAHRLAYRLTVGPIPEGAQLDHFRCDNPPCCNPSHVRPVSARENTLRSSSPSALNAAKRACSRGHEYTETTLWTSATGKRRCRICDRVRARDAYTARKEVNKVQGRGAPKTPDQCPAGHPYDSQNTYVCPNGSFRCRECARLRGIARRAGLRSNASRGSAGVVSTSLSPSIGPQEVQP